MDKAELFISRGCDVCGSSNTQVLYKQSFVSFDGDSGLLAGYDVVACGICGFIYADHLPESAVFDQYYRDMSKHEPEKDITRPVPSYRKHNIELIVSQVRKNFPDRSARILDIGVGSGDVLLTLRGLGYQNLTGIDPSAYTATVVQQHHGIRMLNVPVSQLISVEETFDVILLSGVLEHLRDLRETLSLVGNILSENGAICVAVPDASRFSRCADAPFQYFSVEHINFFTASSLSNLFSTVGMRLRQEYSQSTALLGVFKEPVIHGIFTKGGPPGPMQYNLNDAEGIRFYIEQSEQYQNVLIKKIERFVNSRVSLIIWGAGSLTMHLLSDPGFSALKIDAFVDANANYWDKTIRGVPVLSPAALGTHGSAILIVSYSYEEEIYDEIRNRYNLKNEVVRLFDVNSQP